MADLDRYARQTQLKQIGIDGQKNLLAAKVAIIGAGGLGCSVASLLAGVGIGSIFICDADRIELDNLHRQLLFREHDIGAFKAEVAAREMQRINQTINIEFATQRLSPDTTEKFLQSTDLVIDAADSMIASLLASDFCCTNKIPLLSASVNQLFGYVGGFCGNSPGFRAVFPRASTRLTSCAVSGVSGPAVSLIGAVQAQQAINILGSADNSILGKIHYFDLRTWQTQQIDFSLANEPTKKVPFISQTQLNNNDFIVDVRPAHETQNKPQPFHSHINIEPARLINALPELTTNQRLVLCCQSGQRALVAAQNIAESCTNPVAVLVPD